VLDANILIRAVVARERIDKRDEDDWPVLAGALALGCPIWTEDTVNRCS
jgi:predicted nucleic acid-binding protein